MRDDVRPGLCTKNYRERAVIAFGVVSVIGIFYGGQDYETNLKEDGDVSNAEH